MMFKWIVTGTLMECILEYHCHAATENHALDKWFDHFNDDGAFGQWGFLHETQRQVEATKRWNVKAHMADSTEWKGNGHQYVTDFYDYGRI